MVEELALVSVGLAAIAMISCLAVENRRRIRRMPRAVWVAVILLVPVLGAAAWFLLGRPLSLEPTPGWRRWPGANQPSRRHSPDDDPDFLRSLDDRPDPPPSSA